MSIQTPPGASHPEDSPGRYGRAERISVLSFNTHGDGVPLTGTGRLHSSSFLKPTGFSRRPLCLPSPLTLGRASEKSAMEAEALQEWPSPCRGLLSMSPLCDHVGVHVSFQNFPDVSFISCGERSVLWIQPSALRVPLKQKRSQGVWRGVHVCGCPGGSEGPLGTAED